MGTGTARRTGAGLLSEWAVSRTEWAVQLEVGVMVTGPGRTDDLSQCSAWASGKLFSARRPWESS